jgi:hypothetical protein
MGTFSSTAASMISSSSAIAIRIPVLSGILPRSRREGSAVTTTRSLRLRPGPLAGAMIQRVAEVARFFGQKHQIPHRQQRAEARHQAADMVDGAPHTFGLLPQEDELVASRQRDLVVGEVGEAVDVRLNSSIGRPPPGPAKYS